MAFDTITGEQLRQELAGWMLRNKKGLPLPHSEAAADFLDNFRVPDTDFEMTQSFADGDGEIKVLFKTTVALQSWQTRGGREPAVFSYYKIMKAVTDDDGNVTDYVICGYVVTDI
jgi:hypothetical protein